MASVVSDHGPSWSDVRVMAQEVGKASDCLVDIHAVVGQGTGRSDKVVWTCRAFRWGTYAQGKPWTFTTGLWPNNQNSTVPAMLYRLLHELDAKLEEMRSAERAARPIDLFGE